MSVKHMAWAWNQKVGDPTTKLILMKLADGADETNRSWYSHQTLAEQCDTSKSTVRRHLYALRDSGFIQIIPRMNVNGQTSNYYFIDLTRPPVQTEQPPCSSVDTPPVHSYEQRPINDPLIEKETYKEKAFTEEELEKIVRNPNILRYEE